MKLTTNKINDVTFVFYQNEQTSSTKESDFSCCQPNDGHIQ